MQEEQVRPVSKRTTRKPWVIVSLLVIGLITGGFAFWKANQSSSLLPANIAKNITDFTPYFFFEQIPNGYSLNTSAISFDGDIAIMPLTNPDKPTVVLTEQPLPDNLSSDLLRQDDSQQVKDTASPAIINKIEGRVVGIMTSKSNKLLLLINAPADMPTEDMAKFLQNLKPIR
jgi:hypothetical protein